jgi:hypothetical protein
MRMAENQVCMCYEVSQCLLSALWSRKVKCPFMYGYHPVRSELRLSSDALYHIWLGDGQYTETRYAKIPKPRDMLYETAIEKLDTTSISLLAIKVNYPTHEPQFIGTWSLVVFILSSRRRVTEITKEDKRRAKRTPRPMETGAIYK